MTASAISKALNEYEVADRLGLSVKTLRDWRLRRVGPRFIKFGGAVRYMDTDLAAYIEASAVMTNTR